MTLRIGVDLDGTLADLSSAYGRVHAAIYGKGTSKPETDETQAATDGCPDDPEGPSHTAETGKHDADAKAAAAAKRDEQVRRGVWHSIRNTDDFWTTLAPIEPGLLARLHAAAVTNRWEVYFVTQRPSTAGRTVQLQTQHWLAANGFEMPSVLTLSGSRGRAAAALELDYLIDDLPKNCVDVLSDSKCRPILIFREPHPTEEIAAKRMKIEVVRSVAEAIDFIERDGQTRGKKSVISRVLEKLGL
jgi:hypothetical protein